MLVQIYHFRPSRCLPPGQPWAVWLFPLQLPPVKAAQSDLDKPRLALLQQVGAPEWPRDDSRTAAPFAGSQPTAMPVQADWAPVLAVARARRRAPLASLFLQRTPSIRQDIFEQAASRPALSVSR